MPLNRTNPSFTRPQQTLCHCLHLPWVAVSQPGSTLLLLPASALCHLVASTPVSLLASALGNWTVPALRHCLRLPCVTYRINP
eukprot:1149753-Pelagomonas_calceolata.AAC.1